MVRGQITFHRQITLHNKQYLFISIGIIDCTFEHFQLFNIIGVLIIILSTDLTITSMFSQIMCGFRSDVHY